MGFLHGIEHINLPSGTGIVNDVVTAVIGLVGTSDKGNLNELVLCSSAKDDTKFGTKGTIPAALSAIRKQDSPKGSALVFVVSVARDTDEVSGGTIVGNIDADTGARTGMQLFETAMGDYGYEPMIYIAPRYSALDAVKAELIRITNINEGMYYIDAPEGLSVGEVIKSRGTSGDFGMLTEGGKMLYPQFLIANPDYVEPADEDTAPAEPRYLSAPISAFAAGLRAKIDLEEGWHISSSNHAYTGVEKVSEAMTFSLGSETCEVNQLNAAGITTAVNLYGRGIVEWGNYSAGFPGNSNPDAFECVRRTRAIIKRAIGQASIPFIDKPITQANIDLVRNTVNQYLNSLVSQGKIVAGQCFFRAEHNPATQLAAGHIQFDIEFTPAIPMQRITFTYTIDISKLSTLK